MSSNISLLIFTSLHCQLGIGTGENQCAGNYRENLCLGFNVNANDPDQLADLCCVRIVINLFHCLYDDAVIVDNFLEDKTVDGLMHMLFWA